MCDVACVAVVHEAASYDIAYVAVCCGVHSRPYHRNYDVYRGGVCMQGCMLQEVLCMHTYHVVMHNI